MNEHELKERMSALVADQPPTRYSGALTLRRGRRRLVARRVIAGVSGAALMAVVALAVPALWPTAEPGGQEQSAFAGGLPELTDAEIVQRCIEADNSAMDPEQFGSASRVLVSEISGDRLQAVITADGASVWADCGLFDDPDAEFNGYSYTYPLAVEQSPPGGSGGMLGFGPNGFTWTDRFPEDVARVGIEFRDGRRLSRATVDGFVVFNASGNFLVPGGESDSPNLLAYQTTLYADDGSVLARDGGWEDPGQGLPFEYRSLVPALALEEQ